MLLEWHGPAFHGLCLASSLLGAAGSAVQLRLRRRSPKTPSLQHFDAGQRGNDILFWLATTDLAAALGTKQVQILVERH